MWCGDQTASVDHIPLESRQIVTARLVKTRGLERPDVASLSRFSFFRTTSYKLLTDDDNVKLVRAPE